MDKRLEYVKLVYYEDRKNNNNSWGEVYYKLYYGDDQVDRTYKQKVNKRDFQLCLKAFKMQEGSGYLPFEKYQIYDAKSKKPLNMPYYLKEPTNREIVMDKIKHEFSKVSEKINYEKEKLGVLRREDYFDNDYSTLNSIRGGVSDIRKQHRYRNFNTLNNKKDKKKLLVRITSIATVTVLLGALGNYELKKHKIDFSKMVYITNLSNSRNYLDSEIRDNYVEFENIMQKLINNDYEDIDNESIEFINDYLFKLSKASTDTDAEGKFYEFNYFKYLDKESPDYNFFAKYDSTYNSIVMNEKYKKDNAYEFCAKGCNVINYSNSAIDMNRSSYMPTINDLHSYQSMSPLSKIVFLNQLKGVVRATNFCYKDKDKPYWWIGLNMDNDKLIKKIDSLIEVCNNELKYIMDNYNKNEVSKSL